MDAKDQLAADVSLEEVALDCESFTGSDLREMVRVAKLQRAKHYVASRAAAGGAPAAENSGGLRPLQMADFIDALKKSRSTGAHANDYASQLMFERHQEKTDIHSKAVNMARDAEARKAQPEGSEGSEL